MEAKRRQILNHQVRQQALVFPTVDFYYYAFSWMNDRKNESKYVLSSLMISF